MQSQSHNDFTVSDLTVDTQKLDGILVSISHTIKEYEQYIVKIDKLENHQALLSRDLNSLKLKLSSKEIVHTVGISTISSERSYHHRHHEEQKYDHAVESKSSSPSLSDEESKISCDTERVISRRLQTVKEEIQRSNAHLENLTLQKLRSDVVGLRTITIQLQDEFNVELTNSAYVASQVGDLKHTIHNLEKEMGTSVQSRAILDLKRALSENYDNLFHSIQSLEENFRDDLDCRMKVKALELKSSFNDLENLLHRRQSHWDSKMSTFAKKSDLAAMNENLDNENYDHRTRLDILEEGIVRNEQSLLSIKHHSSIVIFQKCRSIWKQRMQQLAWSRWCDFLKHIADQKQKATERKRKIRQLLIKQWFGRKQSAWKKWLLFIQWHKRIEALKEQAVKLIYTRMQDALNAPMYDAFNQMRRSTIAWKIQKSHQYESKIDAVSNDIGLTTCGNEEKSNFSTTETILPSMHSNHYDLSELLHTFKNDKDGAIHTLAQEVNNIRMYDVKKIRRDMDKGDMMLQENFEKSITVEVSELESKILKLGRKVDDNFQCLSTQLPDMKSHISEMRSSLHGTINRVKIIEQTHRDRIELLCESKETSDERIAELESNLKQAQIKVQGLEYNNDRSQNLINTLLQKMSDFEQSQKESSKSIVNRMAELQKELSLANSKIQSGNEDRSILHEKLCETKNDIIQTKIASKSNFDDVHNIFDTHGIRRPKINIIIEDGVLYEKIAKEKNYVVQLNSILNGTTEIDVTRHIASFAHDYAAWVAYQADHEALQLVVTGKNPEEAIFVEDEMESRREAFIHSFKEELGKALDQAYPDAGSIRLEARTRYVNSVADAISAALSKHDQVFIPASTRLGRVKVSIPTCVACDRPLTTKGKRRPDSEKLDKAGGTGGDKKSAFRPKHTNAKFLNNEIKPFVMRGGFKMPSV